MKNTRGKIVGFYFLCVASTAWPLDRIDLSSISECARLFQTIGQLPTRTLRSSYSSRIDPIIAPLVSPDGPGIAIAIVQDGKLVHQAGYGLSDLSAGTQITPSTAFDIASLTKPITSVAVHLAAREGRLNLDDSIRTHLPELGKQYGPVQIRRLLQHTAGVRDYERAMIEQGLISKPFPAAHGEVAENPKETEPVIQFMTSQPLSFAPGSDFDYTNSGYVFLGKAIERATNMSYEDYLQSRIFDPLGMHDAYVLDSSEKSSLKAAKPYRKTPDGYEWIDSAPFVYVVGDGRIYASVSSVAKFYAGLLGGRLLPLRELPALFRSGRTNDGMATGYAMGWNLHSSFGAHAIGHSGSWLGFRNFAFHDFRTHSSIFALSNSYDLGPTRPRLLLDLYNSLRTGEPNKLNHFDWSESAKKQLTGKYSMGDTPITIRQTNGSLFLEKTGEAPRRILPISSNEFSVEGEPALTVKFTSASLQFHYFVYGDARFSDSRARKIQ